MTISPRRHNGERPFITSGSDEDSEGEQPLHSEHGFALLACGLSLSAMQQILGWIERLGPHRKHHFAGSHMKFIPTMDATISLPNVFLLAFNAGDAAAEKEARGYWARAKHDVPRAGFAVALGKAGLDAVEPFQPELPVIKMSETVPSKQARQLAMAFMGFAGQGLIGIDASDWLAQFGKHHAQAAGAIEAFKKTFPRRWKVSPRTRAAASRGWKSGSLMKRE